VVVDSRRTPTPSRILGGAPEEDKEEETGWRNISMAIEEDEEEETGRRSTSMATASSSTTTGSRGTRRRRRQIEVELGLEWIPAGRRRLSLGTTPPPSELGNRPAAIRICTPRSLAGAPNRTNDTSPMQIKGACPCIARRRGSRELPVAAAIGSKWGSARSRGREPGGARRRAPVDREDDGWDEGEERDT
jgi:hypothetical protein